MSSDAEENKGGTKSKNNSGESSGGNMPFRMTTPRLTMLFMCLVWLVISSMVVRASQMQESSGSNGNGMTSTSTSGRTMTKRMPEMASMAQSDVVDEMAVDTEEPAVMRAQTSSNMMASKHIMSSSSVGGDMLRAWDDSAEKLQQDTTDEKNPVERMLVHNGHLSLWVWKGELQTMVDQIEALVTKDARGYIESRSSYQRNSNNRNRSNNSNNNIKLRSMDLQLRIASDQFTDFVSNIQALVENDDMVQSVSLNSRDVTDSYVDATARAATLDASRTALRTLLEKAVNVNEVMDVQRELNRLTQDYESQKSRAMNLKAQANLSSLSVQLQEQVRDDDANNNTTNAFWTPMTSLLLAWEHMGTFCGFVGDTLAYAVAWAIPMALLYACVVVPIVRARGNSKSPLQATMPSY